MLQEKIKLNYKLTALIKKARDDKGITAAKLSTDIGKTISYISSLEHNRIKYIESKDFIEIVKILFNLNNGAAESKIENWLSDKEINNDNNVFEHIFKNNSEIDSGTTYTHNLDNIIDQQVYSDMLNSLKRAFMAYYKRDSKKAILTLNRLLSSMKSDLGFTMAFVSTPIIVLDKVSVDEKQKILNNMMGLFEPYVNKFIEENSTDNEDNENNSEIN
jgi:transcriptional regulator with XRE-family HTH domain